MAPLYSTRFLAQLAGQGANYTVPAGHTAVVRCVTIYNSSTTAVGSFNLQIGPAGIMIVGAYVPVLSQSNTLNLQIYDVRVPVNAGELIELALSPTVMGTVSGYLFV